MGVVNSLAVRHKTGRILVEDEASIAATGRTIRKHLSLADLPEADARLAAQRVLAERAQPRSSWTAQLEVEAGTTGAPYTSWRPFDTTSWNGTPIRCVAMTITFDRAGNPTFEPTLQTRRQFLAERAEISLARSSSNNLDGTARQATALDGISSGVAAGAVQRERLDAVEAEIPSTTFPRSTSAAFQVDETLHVCRFSLRQVVQNSTNPTVIRLLENGSPKSLTEYGYATGPDIVLPAGTTHIIRQPEYLHLVPVVAAYQFEITDCDPETDDPEADARFLRLEIVATKVNPAAVTPATPSAPWE